MALVPFRCGACGAPLAATDADAATCPGCGARQPVPEEHRRAVVLMRAAVSADQRAFDTWRAYSRLTIPWGATYLANAALLVVTFGGLGIAFAERQGWAETVADPYLLLGGTLGVGIPALMALSALAFWYADTTARGIESLRRAIAGNAGAAPGAPPRCRMCGAPLTVQPSDEFVRCLYCNADNLVTLDAMRARALAGEVSRADASVVRAVEAFSVRREAWWKGPAAAALMALLGLPTAIWAFGGRAFQGHGWAMAAAWTGWLEVFFPPAMVLMNAHWGGPSGAGGVGARQAQLAQKKSKLPLVAVLLGVLAIVLFVGAVLPGCLSWS